jgi:hypothetical protein
MVNRSLKTSVGMRLSNEARRLLRVLAGQSGLSQAGVVELAIRRMAKAEGVEVREETPEATA